MYLYKETYLPLPLLSYCTLEIYSVPKSQADMITQRNFTVQCEPPSSFLAELDRNRLLTILIVDNDPFA